MADVRLSRWEAKASACVNDRLVRYSLDTNDTETTTVTKIINMTRRVVSRRVVSRRVVSCRVVSRRVASCRVVSRRVASVVASSFFYIVYIVYMFT